MKLMFEELHKSLMSEQVMSFMNVTLFSAAQEVAGFGRGSLQPGLCRIPVWEFSPNCPT